MNKPYQNIMLPFLHNNCSYCMKMCTIVVLHLIVTKNYHKYLVARSDCITVLIAE